MKALFSALLLTASASAYAQVEATKPGLEVLEQKYGFRDAQLGADTTAFTDLHSIGQRVGNIRSYWRSSTPKTIGDAAIKDIIYYFYKGKVFAIAVQPEGQAAGQIMLRALVAKYGEGAQETRDKYNWVTKRVAMQYAEKPYSDEVRILIASRPIQAQIDADEAAAAKKAASDL